MRCSFILVLLGAFAAAPVAAATSRFPAPSPVSTQPEASLALSRFGQVCQTPRDAQTLLPVQCRCYGQMLTAREQQLYVELWEASARKARLTASQEQGRLQLEARFAQLSQRCHPPQLSPVLQPPSIPAPPRIP